jgi:hypothetical protein
MSRMRRSSRSSSSKLGPALGRIADERTCRACAGPRVPPGGHGASQTPGARRRRNPYAIGACRGGGSLRRKPTQVIHFVGLHLADRGWVPSSVGLVLTAGGLAGLLTQIPAGELIDTIKSKRVLVSTGAVAVVLGLFTLALRPDFASVFAAAVIRHGGKRHRPWDRRHHAWPSWARRAGWPARLQSAIGPLSLH